MIRWKRFFGALSMLVTVAGLSACALGSAGGAVGPRATSPPPDTDLSAQLEVPAALPDGQSVPVEFTLVNESDTGLYVLTWYTPLEGVAGEVFRVTRYGEPLPYDGPLVMRADPTPEDYVFVEAGGSVSATVDLAAAGDTGLPIYDFSTPGEYTVSFLSPRISHVAATEDQMATSVDDLGLVQIPAEEVKVRIGDSRDPSVRRTTGQAEAMIRDYWLNRKPNLSPEFRLAEAELPTHDVWEHLSVQLFRVTEGPYALETFLISGETVLRLGTAVGGGGVSSLKVSDLDQDGFAELLFSYSFGSGIHQSRIGMYAPACADDRIYEAGTAYLGDMVLVQEDMADVGVRVVQADDATKTLRYSGTVGHLTLRAYDERVNLSLEVSHDLPEAVLEKLKTIPAPAEDEAPEPDSAAGLIYAASGKLWGVDPDGSAVVLIDQLDSSASDVRISSDGRWAIFSSRLDTPGNSDVWLVDRESGTRRNLTETPDRDEVDPAWWPGRSDVVVFGSDASVDGMGIGYPSVVGIDGGGYRVLDDEDGGPFAPSPDGRMIAYGGYDNVGSIYHWDAGPEPFDPAHYGIAVEKLYQPAWQPGGKQLAWKVGGDLTGQGKWQLGIATFDLQADTAEVLHPFEPIGGTFPDYLAWRPDGEWLAFVTYQEPPAQGRLPNLWVVRARDREEVYVGAGVDPTWSPDSQQLAFTSVKDDEFGIAIAEVGVWHPRQLDRPHEVQSIRAWIRPRSLTK